MNTIYWRMNATQGGANLHPGVNLLPGANLHPGANCAHEHGLRHVRHPKSSTYRRRPVRLHHVFLTFEKLEKHLD